jgi:hypothetical protein
MLQENDHLGLATLVDIHQRGGLDLKAFAESRHAAVSGRR